MHSPCFGPPEGINFLAARVSGEHLRFDDLTSAPGAICCYSHVFNGHPEGSISSLAYLPNQEEEIFLLLRPDHVHQMLKSLDDHSDDLRVMKVSDIQRLERWRDLCAADPSYMVAYQFDY